jgi:DNA-binding MarR family transcriptional regulator
MAVNPYDVYLEMESAWRAGIPKRLRGMKPEEVVKLVRLAAAEKGVSQGTAASALGQSQSGMSRVTAKFVEAKWVMVTRSTDDHKQKLITATPKARLAMETLKGKLAAAMKGKDTRRTSQEDALRRQHGGRTLFTPTVECEEM